MSVWLDEKGSRLEVVDGSLVFFDRLGNQTSFGTVAVDAAPEVAAAELPARLASGPAGAVVPFFVKGAWGAVGALAELIPIADSQLLILSSPKPLSWYARDYSRVLLVETTVGVDLIRLLRSLVGSDLLHSKSPTNGSWVHFAALATKTKKENAAAWHGKTFLHLSDNDDYAPDEAAFTRVAQKDYAAASEALGAWILQQCRDGNPLQGLRVNENLPLGKEDYAALDEAFGPKNTKRLAKEELAKAKKRKTG